MIGQKTLLNVIHEQIEMDEFPRFSILIGAEGSGKKTVSFEVAKMLDMPRVFIEPKVDKIREMIDNAYKIASPVLYVILDADNMSIQAKNALLKVCEETPNNAYIMMLVCDANNLLDTLKSRAGRYYMQPYTPEELLEYADVDKGNEYIITDLCETPGDVDKLLAIGINEFYAYVEKVVNNVASVSSANAFKIANQIDFKGTDPDKYDMTLFLRAFKAVCGNELKKSVAENDVEGQMWFSAGIKVVSNALSKIQITGINKGALFDIFILDIRREWA